MSLNSEIEKYKRQIYENIDETIYDRELTVSTTSSIRSDLKAHISSI